MNYIRIENTGLIEIEDLTLIGSSSKRDQDDKIGMFGSGWKYALAYLMRNDLTPVIFRAEDRINIDTNIILHRDKPTEIITVNGKQTSLTTEMGPLWTGWMALREIVSNAIDEGGYRISQYFESDESQLKGQAGKTVIYIKMNNELSKVMINFQSYFSFSRKPIYSNTHGKIYAKPEQSETTIYRRGIKCNENKIICNYDFDFNDIVINESRLASSSTILYSIQEILNHKTTPTEIVKNFMTKDLVRYLDYYFNDDEETIGGHLEKVIIDGYKLLPQSFIKLLGVLAEQGKVAVIPDKWYKIAGNKGLLDERSLTGNGYTFYETNEKMNTEFIKYHLSAFNITDVEIKTGACVPEVYCEHNPNGSMTIYLDVDIFKRHNAEVIAGIIIKAAPIEYLTQKME